MPIVGSGFMFGTIVFNGSAVVALPTPPIAASGVLALTGRMIDGSMPGGSGTLTLTGEASVVAVALADAEDDIRNHVDRDTKGLLPEARTDYDPSTGHYHDGVASRPVTGSAGWQDDGAFIRQQTPGDKVVIGATTPDTLGLVDMASDRLRLRNLLYVENGASTPTEFTDSSGNGRHAPITGAGTAVFGVTDLQTGVEDFAVELNGGTYCDVDAITPGATNYSLVYLCKPDTGAGAIWGQFAGGANGEYFYVNGATGDIYNSTFGNPVQTVYGSFTPGQTILLAIVWDATAGKQKVYLNGTKLTPEGNYTGYVPDQVKLFAVYNGSGPAQGIFDELAWYDRALTGTEITDLWNAYGFGNLQAALAGSAPWAYYKLNDGAGTPGRDGEIGVNPDGIVVRVGSSWEIAPFAAGAGLTNPMNAAGDVIIGGTLGAPLRLGLGTLGQAFVAGASAPAWGTLGIVGGGTGAITAATARTNLGVGTGDSPTLTALTLSAGPVSIGAAPASAGAVRLSNNSGIYGRNAAGSANLALVYIANDNTAYYGDDLNAGNVYQTAGSHTWEIGGAVKLALSPTTLTLSGGMTVDTDVLAVDAASNRVGVGIALPVFHFHAENNAGLGAIATVAAFSRVESGPTHATYLSVDIDARSTQSIIRFTGSATTLHPTFVWQTGGVDQMKVSTTGLTVAGGALIGLTAATYGGQLVVKPSFRVETTTTNSNDAGSIAMSGAWSDTTAAHFGFVLNNQSGAVQPVYDAVRLQVYSGAAWSIGLLLRKSGEIRLGTDLNGNSPKLMIDTAGTVTIPGALAVDGTTLYVDAVNDRVGIGTSSPSALLDVDSSASFVRVRIKNNSTADGSTAQQLVGSTGGGGNNYLIQYVYAGASTGNAFGVPRGGLTVLECGGDSTMLALHMGNTTAGDIIFAFNVTERHRFTRAGAIQIPDGITAPATRASWASLYVDSADGDLKVKFGDGTVKTIMTDT